MAGLKSIKTLALSAAATGLMVAGTVPANAQSRESRDYSRDRDGISVGEIIAGVAILGGLAAILGGGRNRNDPYRGNGTYGYEYDQPYNTGYGYEQSQYGGSREAVEQCVNAASYEARRYNRAARVTDIRDIDRKRDGYDIKGRVEANQVYGGYDRRYGNYDRGYNDRYGSNYGNNSNYGRDTGSFTCKVRYGRVADVRVSGISRT